MINSDLLQFIKYGMVGVVNTLITLVTILICKSVLGMDPYLSNAIGYALGFTNSFLCNKKWVFRTSGHYRREVTMFLAGSGLCYLLQLLTVWVLSAHTALGPMMWHLPFFTLSGYGVATLVGNVVYTACNFIYNKLVTFRLGAKD